MTELMSPELADANQRLMSFEKPLKELYKYYREASDNRRDTFANPSYLTKEHMINAFEKCQKNEIDIDDLFKWIQEIYHCNSIKFEPKYRNLIATIFSDFESFDIYPDDDMPDMDYIAMTLKKLQDAQPEIDA